MTPAKIYRCIAALSPEKKAEVLINMGRIFAPDAEKIGAVLGKMPQTREMEPMHDFISNMYVSFSRQFNKASEVDFIDESLSGLKIGVSFDKGPIIAWASEGCELPSWLMPEIESKMFTLFRNMKVA